MRALRDIRISIPAQAVIVIVITGFWYFTWWRSGKGFLSNLHLFWGASFFLAPVVAMIFATVLFVSHVRAGERHRWWVIPAVLFAFTPLPCFLLSIR